MNILHTNCPFPECKNVEGQQLDNNKMVWYHVTTDNRGRKLTHKWSVKSGRPFSLKAGEEDEVL